MGRGAGRSVVAANLTHSRASYAESRLLIGRQPERRAKDSCPCSLALRLATNHQDSVSLLRNQTRRWTCGRCVASGAEPPPAVRPSTAWSSAPGFGRKKPRLPTLPTAADRIPRASSPGSRRRLRSGRGVKLGRVRQSRLVVIRFDAGAQTAFTASGAGWAGRRPADGAWAFDATLFEVFCQPGGAAGRE